MWYMQQAVWFNAGDRAPPHTAGAWPESLSLRREDIYIIARERLERGFQDPEPLTISRQVVREYRAADALNDVERLISASSAPSRCLRMAPS